MRNPELLHDDLEYTGNTEMVLNHLFKRRQSTTQNTECAC